MKLRLLYIGSILALYSCKTIVPKIDRNIGLGYYHQYDKLDFNKIAFSADTNWHKQVKPLAELLLNHPNWTVKLKTFLAYDRPDSTKGLDSKVCHEITQYLCNQGLCKDITKIIPMFYNKSDDSGRKVYGGLNPKKKFKNRHFKKDTFEWEIIRID